VECSPADGAAVAPYRLEQRDGIALVRLRCGKGNALNERSLSAIEAALDEAASGEAGGVVLTGSDGFFSAGLDLVGLYRVERDAMDRFMRRFDGVMLRVFEFPRPVVAAVGGHAVAGGAVLALACDARVMGDGAGRFGLNEIRLGLPFPASALEIVRHAVPPGAVEPALYEGELLDGAGALGRGLVGSLVPGDPVEAALEACARLRAGPGSAFATVKASLRAPAAERARAAADRLRRAFLDAWYAPEARRRIGEVRARLAG
jgi:enoyl-CoA hydratase